MDEHTDAEGPEQTAEYLSGGELGNPTVHDPAVKAKLDEQHRLLREATFNKVIPAIADALDEHSAQTAVRLRQLSQMAHAGDRRAHQLLGVMLGQLLTWGLKP